MLFTRSGFIVLRNMHLYSVQDKTLFRVTWCRENIDEYSISVCSCSGYLLHGVDGDGERGVVPGHLVVVPLHAQRPQRAQRVQRGRARRAAGARAGQRHARRHHHHAARHHADQQRHVVCGVGASIWAQTVYTK